MDIIEATQRFETWLGRRIPVVKADLDFKREQMRADPFLFFRATFYRWSQLWPKLCPKLARTPVVMAVGDLHLENFGTWRDTEGRLIWGVNDFDEAYPLPFAHDLVRLAVSALLSLHVDPSLPLQSSDIFEQLLEGYRASMKRGGEPLVLMERHPALRRMATQQLRQPAEFWPRLDEKLVRLSHALPDGLRRSFRKLLPEGAKPAFYRIKVPKGLGSLGRRRILAVAEWEGGQIAREAKDVVPSACLWAAGERAGKGNPWLERTVEAAVRCADPLYQVKGRWLLRRLGPDCCRIDLDQLRHHEDLASLLHSMGWETANIHLGTRNARRKTGQALQALKGNWLEDAARTLLEKTLRDWQNFRKATR
jgi:hypothetical protein